MGGEGEAGGRRSPRGALAGREKPHAARAFAHFHWVMSCVGQEKGCNSTLAGAPSAVCEVTRSPSCNYSLPLSTGSGGSPVSPVSPVSGWGRQLGAGEWHLDSGPCHPQEGTTLGQSACPGLSSASPLLLCPPQTLHILLFPPATGPA